MEDLLIKELFPNRIPSFVNRIISSSFPDSLSEDIDYPNWNNHGDFAIPTPPPKLYNGEFDISFCQSHYGQAFQPSSYAKQNLIYIHILCSATFNSHHYSKGKNISSYMLAQTFYGKGGLSYEGKEYELNVNDVFFIDCRKEHKYFSISSEGWGYRFIHLNGNYLPSLYRAIAENNNVKFTFEQSSHFEELFKELLLVNSSLNVNKEILTNRILIDMITEVLCQCSTPQIIKIPDEIRSVCELIQSSFNTELNLDQISKDIGMSKYNLSRKFKKYTGQTIFAYITSQRISAAKELLSNSSMPISKIAEAVGYTSTHSFYNAFNQVEGMSPSKFRKES